jgi:hypothetical protein
MASSRPLELTSAAASWLFMIHSSFVADSAAIAFPDRRKPVNTRVKTKNFLIAFSSVSISAVFDGIAKSQNQALP